MSTSQMQGFNCDSFVMLTNRLKTVRRKTIWKTFTDCIHNNTKQSNQTVEDRFWKIVLQTDKQINRQRTEWREMP